MFTKDQCFEAYEGVWSLDVKFLPDEKGNPIIFVSLEELQGMVDEYPEEFKPNVLRDVLFDEDELAYLPDLLAK